MIVSKTGWCVVIGFILAVSSAIAQPHYSTAMLGEYLELVQSYNLESAGYLWEESIQERSARFGIEFTGISLKADCASPFIQRLDELRHLLTNAVETYEVIDGDNFLKLKCSIRQQDQEFRHDYYAVKLGGYYWLTAPQNYYARDWPVKVSKYFRIHCHPDVEKYVNAHGLDELDRFLENTADKLKMSPADLEMIAREKIEYFYCNSDKTVELITGQLTRGLLDLATSDIITATFPHQHELIHLLVNINLKKLPLFTLPLLREGVAVKYGGRWGKRPEALLSLSAYLVNQHLVELDSLLTYNDFQVSAAADIAYPVAGQFASFLMDRLGYERFFQMYLDLSGSAEEVQGWQAEDVKAVLLTVTEYKDWVELVLAFGRYIDQQVARREIAEAGMPDDVSEILSGDGFRVFENKQWYSFVFSSESADPPRGNLLFGSELAESEGPSFLFDEQYHDRVGREKYRFGLRYDQFEAGLYDYVTNELAAKYILGISPSAEYYDPETNTVTVRLRKSLFENVFTKDVKVRLLPN